VWAHCNLYFDEDGEGAEEKFRKSDSISGELVRRLSLVKETSSAGEGKGIGGSAGQEDASSYEEISVGHLIGEDEDVDEDENRTGRDSCIILPILALDSLRSALTPPSGIRIGIVIGI
jgi:hypothetical protein